MKKTRSKKSRDTLPDHMEQIVYVRYLDTVRTVTETSTMRRPSSWNTKNNEAKKNKYASFGVLTKRCVDFLHLKVLTDHSNSEERLGSFDP